MVGFLLFMICYIFIVVLCDNANWLPAKHVAKLSEEVAYEKNIRTVSLLPLIKRFFFVK